MEKNISNLKEIIKQETAVLENLSSLFIKQKAAAIEGDLQLLNEITAEQGKMFAKIAEFEKLRLEIVEPLADELDIEPEDVTLEIIRKHVGTENTRQLDKIYDMLKPMLEKVKRATNLNMRIVEKILMTGEQRLKMMLDFRTKKDTYNFAGKKKDNGGNSSVVYNKKA
ncbi:MAG: flagellar export chaperone FlgN [Candidatus Marinimicrobia bacterium]|nr:flagellar export chaperone FlgN [Candidatus Neomarinimicrobiota bacterium]